MAKKKVTRRVALEDGTPALHRKLAARVRAALRDLGIKDTLAEIQLDPPKGKARATAARGRGAATSRAGVRKRATLAPSATVPCPAGTTRRMVCSFQGGEFVCEPKCVPRA